MSLLRVSNVCKSIREETVLHNVSIHYTSFRRMAIAGATGSGKTTLLKIIGGLVQPDSGSIFFEEERVPGPDEKLLPGHPRIAYLSQHFELRNNYRVHDFLEMASKVGEAEARRLYQLCQIDHLLRRKTDQLSGGERQRTALARLLTTRPRLLLLDEPYSNLDGIHKQTLKEVINGIVEEGKTACIMVSHDPSDVLPWAEEILVLQDGRLVQQAAPQQVYAKPVSEYAGALFGDFNLLSAAEARQFLGLENKMVEKKCFIRPENIRLEKGEGNRTNGTVTAVLFFGSYCEIEVQFSQTKLLVKTTQAGLAKGDRVTAGVLPEHVWFL